MNPVGSVQQIPPADLPQGSGFMQTPWWGQFKSHAGWVPQAYVNDRGAGMLLLHRRVAPGLRLAYVPHGPEAGFLGPVVCDHIDTVEDAQIVSAALSRVAAEIAPTLPRDTAIIRFDPPWMLDADTFSPTARKQAFRLRHGYTEKDRPSLSASASDIQPPDTVILDLAPELDAILANMKPKWRYNIRLATKKGVRIRVSKPDELDRDIEEFYRMYRITADRDRITIHSPSYYERFLKLSPDQMPVRELLCAEHDGEMIAAIITARTTQRATYVFGAASDQKRNLMPAYALQWEAIQRAREAGCVEYDFFGIPPSDDTDHPMHGLYRFKTGFGGSQKMMPGTLDANLRVLHAGAYRQAEAVRMWYYRRFRKLS
ncbi:MAG: peptidoglycan bridge formation glycyltransferase FemA/FemB family protein [Spirochaetaceae bacterium]|nr:MAG: peptidoglycan bridge formation glycyltransferase FemA/FemB family protein [Spirochaetaceae bacterium]